MGKSVKFTLNIENNDVLDNFVRLARAVPASAPKALDAMANVIRPALIAAAPYDSNPRHREKHLKQVIKRSKIKQIGLGYGTGHITSIWLMPRGIPGAKKSPRASKNWDADKQVYKLVVAEFGRSDMRAKPFWEPTVKRVSNEAVNAAVEVMQKEMDGNGY